MFIILDWLKSKLSIIGVAVGSVITGMVSLFLYRRSIEKTTTNRIKSDLDKANAEAQLEYLQTEAKTIEEIDGLINNLPNSWAEYDKLRQDNRFTNKNKKK